MVKTTYKYRAHPENNQTANRAWDAIQTCRQVYNHALSQEYKPAPQYDKPSYTTIQDKLLEWKNKWTEWKKSTLKHCKWRFDASKTANQYWMN